MNYTRLDKTWLFDIDGTIVIHAGITEKGYDTLIKNAKEAFDLIPKSDTIILLTARKETLKEETINFLKTNNIRFDHIIFNLGVGERILINDIKPSGYLTAYAENVKRNESINLDTIRKYL